MESDLFFPITEALKLQVGERTGLPPRPAYQIPASLLPYSWGKCQQELSLA